MYTIYHDLNNMGELSGENVKFDLAFEMINLETNLPAPEIDTTYIMPVVFLRSHQTREIVYSAMEACD